MELAAILTVRYLLDKFKCIETNEFESVIFCSKVLVWVFLIAELVKYQVNGSIVINVTLALDQMKQLSCSVQFFFKQSCYFKCLIRTVINRIFHVIK